MNLSAILSTIVKTLVHLIEVHRCLQVIFTFSALQILKKGKKDKEKSSVSPVFII